MNFLTSVLKHRSIQRKKLRIKSWKGGFQLYCVPDFISKGLQQGNHMIPQHIQPGLRGPETTNPSRMCLTYTQPDFLRRSHEDQVRE